MIPNFDYAARVKNGAGWRAFERVRIFISVGQPYHEGNKLRAAVDWINRNPSIQEVHVSVNDFLQRHNLIASGIAAERAGATSIAEGGLWIACNQDTLNRLQMHCRVTRWCDWYDQSCFPATLSSLTDYACADVIFEEAIERDAHALAARKAKRGEAVPYFEKLVQHSRDYVTEELAVFALQAKALPAAEVYPGSNLASAEYLVSKALPPAIEPLATRHFTRIDFAHITTPNSGRAPSMPTLKIA
ncbi:MAG: hypothetical protein AB7O13_24805 [Alphaproteobacteria bacterium]